MDTETAEELDLLRARAYGPSADIHTDESAQRRLRELEGLARVRETTASAAIAPPTPAADDQRVSEARAVPDPADARVGEASRVADEVSQDAAVLSGAPDDDVAHAPRRHPSRVVHVVWAGSILATAAVASVVTYGLVAMAPVSASSGAPQIATLHPQPPGEVPSGWFGAGPSSRSWEFYGLTLFETSSGMFGGGGGDCVMVVTSDDVPAADEPIPENTSLSGLVTSACRVGAFPATIELTVDSGAPKELRAAYPDSALQFVKQGDEIGVFRDAG